MVYMQDPIDSLWFSFLLPKHVVYGKMILIPRSHQLKIGQSGKIIEGEQRVRLMVLWLSIYKVQVIIIQ